MSKAFIDRRQRSSLGSQGHAQSFGLPVKATHPELATLVGHVGLRGGPRCRDQGAALQKASDQERGDHTDTEAEIRQGELRQQGNRAPTRPAQIPAHTDYAIPGTLDQRTGIETMTEQRLLGLALRAMVGPVSIGAGDLLLVLRDRAREGV